MEIKIHCKYDELLNPKKLKNHPKNRNKHGQDQIERLAEMYKYHGIRHPIIVSKQSNCIVAGHGRKLAALRCGINEFPVEYQDFDSDEAEYAFLQADNAIALWAELDLSGINSDLGDLGPDFDINMLGIKDFKLDLSEDFEGNGDPDEVPEDVPTKAKLGDLFILGEHRLLCGDSTDLETVERLMNGEKADMVFTDPPYNQETTGGEVGPIGSALRKQSREIEHLCDFDPCEFLNVLPLPFVKGKINALVFCNKDLVVDYLKWARESGFSYNILFWKKPSAIPIGGSYRPDVEYLLNFRKSGIFNSGLKDVDYSKCLEFAREKDKVHPTMKPVNMIENQLKIGSNANSIVVDFFGGSGSTLIACEKTKRKCFMMEIDPHYIDVIIARWQKFSNKKAVREDGVLFDDIEVGK